MPRGNGTGPAGMRLMSGRAAGFCAGSRDEFNPQSDIDLLVDFDREVGLFYLFEIQHKLEDIIGVPKIDLIQRGAIHPALRDRILSEAINVT